MIGISYNDFWNMNPRIIKAIRKGYELEQKKKDEELWLAGLYNHHAVATAIAICFSKNSKVQYLKKPFMADYIAKEEISEEKRIEMENYKLAMSLRIMQANHEIKEKRKSRDGMVS